MTRQQHVPLPGDLSLRLGRLEACVRRLKLMRGIGIFITVAAVALGAGFLIDLTWALSAPVRLGLLVAVGLVCLSALAAFVLRPSFRRYTPAELAAVVENAHPDLRERLTSTIELEDPEVPEEYKGSAFMRELLAGQTVASARNVDFNDAVSRKRSVRWSIAGLAALVVLLTPFVLSPSGYGLLWARLFAPWGNFDSASNLYFDIEDGDRVVARGSDVTLTAVPRFRVEEEPLPESVRLNWEDAAGQSDSRRMEYDAEAGSYVATLPHVFHSFDFNVSAGRARSRMYHVNVVEAPEIVSLTLDVQPPAYTGLPAEKHDGLIGEITVFERSRLTLHLEFNKPLASASLDWIDLVDPALADGTNAGGQPLKLKKPEPKEYGLALAKDGRSATLELTATDSGLFAVRLADEYGLPNSEFTPRKLIVTRDQPPTLALGGTDRPQKVRPDATFPVGVKAEDDTGVSAVELHYNIMAAGSLEETKGVLALDKSRLGRRSVSHVFELELASFGMKSGSSLAYKVRAADERPVPGPNEVWSEPRVLMIDDDARPVGSSELAERQKQLKESLAAIRKDLGENREEVADVRKQSEEDLRKRREFTRNDDLPPLAAGQEQIAQRLEELAARFAENPIMANLIEKTQEVARDDVAKASRDLKQAADLPAADLKEKSKALEQNVAQVAEAERKLAELEREFDKLAELERDLLELNRLAQDAKRLADEAKALEERMTNPPAGESPEEQQAREREIARKQQQLQKEQSELARQLDDLLRRRPELVDAARKQQLDRLAELAKKALELAEPQDLLADALKQEASRAAKEAEALAKRQEELVEQADKLAGEAEPGAKAPVTPLDPEMLRKALEDLKAGNLKNAADSQEQAAADLERLAEELDNNRRLPDDPQQAARELAKRQDELQKKIAERAKEAPRPDATDEEREAFKKAMRPLAAEQAGIQSGVARMQAPSRNRDEQQKTLEKAAEATEQLLAGKSKEAARSADETSKALGELAKSIGSKEERKARARGELAQLRKQQEGLSRDVARQTEKTKKGEQPGDEAAKELKKLGERQEALARDLAGLDAPDADAEHRQAVRKSAAALMDLERARAQDADASQAQAQQAMARLDKKLAGEPLPEEAVKALAQRQARINKEAEPALKDADKPISDENQKQLKARAKDQKEIAGELAKVDAPAARKEQQAAREAAEEAGRQLAEPSDPKAVDAALKKAGDAIKQLQAAVDPADQPQPPAEQARELAEREQAFAEQAGQTADPKELEKAAETARRLAEEQKQLQQQVAELQKRHAAGGQPQQEKGKPAQPEQGDPSESAREALAKQQRLARDAAQLALDTARQSGPESSAAQEATEFARKADQAGQQAMTGQLGKAGETGKEASQSAKQAAGHLARSDRPEESKLGKRADELGKSQEELADTFQKLAESPRGRMQAQHLGQARLASETDDLAKELGDAARKLAAAPLSLEQPAQKAGAAGKSASQAREAMQQAAGGVEEGDAGEAAQDARRAAESLRQAAREAGETPAPQKPSPAPEQLAGQVAEAARHLAQAKQQLAEAAQQAGQAGQNPADQSGQVVPAGAEMAEQPDASSQMRRAAQSLQEAARALAQACKECQGGGQGQGQPGSPQQPAGQGQLAENGNQGEETGDGGTGARAAVDLQTLESELKSLSSRQWGQLPGHLRTEILEAARKRPNSDYARLIKLYFKEIATPQKPAASRSAGNKSK